MMTPRRTPPIPRCGTPVPPFCERFIGLLALLLATVWLGGCAVIDGSGKQASELREVEAAVELAVCCGFEVELTIDPDAEPTVRITTDDNLLQEVSTETSGEKLQIGWHNAHDIHNPTDPVRIEATMPALRRFEGSGGVELSTLDISRSKLRLDLSGGSRASFGEVDVDELDLNESGGSEVTIELLLVELAELASSGGSRLEAQGTASELSADISGGGTLTAEDLICQQATLHLSGGSEAKLTATQRLEGAASGGSQIWVSGDPTIDMDLSGDSQLHRP